MALLNDEVGKRLEKLTGKPTRGFRGSPWYKNLDDAVETLQKHSELLTKLLESDADIKKEDLNQVREGNSYIISKMKKDPKEYNRILEPSPSVAPPTGKTMHPLGNQAAGQGKVPMVEPDGSIKFMRPPKEEK